MTSDFFEEANSCGNLLDQVAEEIRAVFTNSIILCVFSLALQIVGWEDSILKLVMHILVCLAVVQYSYEYRTTKLPFTDLLLRFGTTLVIYLLSSILMGQLKEVEFLRSDDLSQYNTPGNRAILVTISVAAEFLESWRLISLIRSYIVGFILFFAIVPLTANAIFSIINKVTNRAGAVNE